MFVTFNAQIVLCGSARTFKRIVVGFVFVVVVVVVVASFIWLSKIFETFCVQFVRIYALTHKQAFDLYIEIYRETEKICLYYIGNIPHRMYIIRNIVA